MNILVIGAAENLLESEQKFGDQHQFTIASDHRKAEKLLSGHDLIFDFLIDQNPQNIGIYSNCFATVFLNTTKITLSRLMTPTQSSGKAKFFGFNGLATFLSTPILETSVAKQEDKDHLRIVCEKLNTSYSIVGDQVGLVAPRIIAMIINEAYFTVQEKTASREDIDLAMKLGTNYPYGPFEWCERIGLKQVCELLEALFEDTKDDRYKVCPLLKKEYLQAQI